MKIYTKSNETNTFYMYDDEKNHGICINNFSVWSNLPCEISSTVYANIIKEGNIIIDELEFHEAYDKAIDSLQNFVP